MESSASENCVAQRVLTFWGSGPRCKTWHFT